MLSTFSTRELYKETKQIHYSYSNSMGKLSKPPERKQGRDGQREERERERERKKERDASANNLTIRTQPKHYSGRNYDTVDLDLAFHRGLGKIPSNTMDNQ